MKIARAKLCLGILALTFSCGSFASIVNTGPGPGDGLEPGFGLDSNQWLAVQFELSQDETIASIEGWMLTFPRVGASGTIAIYSNDSGLPGTEIFSSPFESVGLDLNEEWEGAHGLAWNLVAGTYFASFEVRAGQTLQGQMPWGVASPTAKSVFRNEFGEWGGISTDMDDLGLRISAVPLPPALWIFGSALIFLRGRKH